MKGIKVSGIKIRCFPVNIDEVISIGHFESEGTKFLNPQSYIRTYRTQKSTA